MVWAPRAHGVGLNVGSRTVRMKKADRGYWVGRTEAAPGAEYTYNLDGLVRPDPASHFQRMGVHGPSVIVDHKQYEWKDQGWEGLPLEQLVMYEIHIGSFTEEGTFEAAVDRLPDLLDLGINAIEVMPIAQFVGDRGWGYDGVYPFAVQNSYGGPDGFKRFVDACHGYGLAAFLDVVYNHLGPEGNYLPDFGFYFSSKYLTPWGKAINFDGPYSNEVRNYFIENALHWFENYHLDGLRLDAVHGIYDFSATHFLEELSGRVARFSETGRKRLLIAESDLNDSRIVKSINVGGYGIDAQWCDDVHHCLHTVLTGESEGYYADFGDVDQLVRALQDGYFYQGQYSRYRKKNHGNCCAYLPGKRFVCYIQNHDQVGNRVLGNRLSTLVPFEALKVAAGILLVTPYVPLLFMGEEYGENAPFLFFVDCCQELLERIRAGRRKEFKYFCAHSLAPDPGDVATFLKTRLKWTERGMDKGKALLGFYKDLLRLRRTIPCLSRPDKGNFEVRKTGSKAISMIRRNAGSEIIALANMSAENSQIECAFGAKNIVLIDSTHARYGGKGVAPALEIKGNQSLTLDPYQFILFLANTDTEAS